jgi:uncharacterized protein (TIGR02246 family)
MRVRAYLVPCLALSLLSADLWSQEPVSGDEAAIRQNAAAYADAFNRGDAEAIAAMWSPEGVLVDTDTGEEVRGREAISERLAKLFAGESRPHASVAVTSVRMVTDDVAVEDGVTTFVSPEGGASTSSYSAVNVKKDGAWLIDSVRETVLPPPPTSFDRLQSLAWLVGEWVDRDETATVHTVNRWSANGAFLTQTFTVLSEGQINLQGTQIVGWDPVRGVIRSWMFDSDGGFGEGVWEIDGDRIVVHASSTVPDGRTGSSVNVYTRVNDDYFTWSSSSRQVGGELLPSIPAFDVYRYQAAPVAPSTSVQE